MCSSNKTRTPTSWWGSAKRDDIRATVVSDRQVFTMLLTGNSWWHVPGCDVKAVAWWEILKLLAVALMGGGADGLNAICNRPEVADDVISGYNVETFRDYHAANLRVASVSSFLENLNQPPRWPRYVPLGLGPIFGAKKQKCMVSYHNEALESLFTKKLFEIGSAAIKKSRPEHDPKLTRLCDLLRRPEADCDVISGIPVEM